VSSVVCVLLPRFELAVAVGSRARLLQEPAALAPEPGREQLVGEVSAPAEAFGIHPGMRLGEALARCPRLALVPPDPVGVAEAWERVLRRLEATGAHVEPGRPGLACFDATGLRRLHGGSLEAVLAATREGLRGPGRAAERARSASDPRAAPTAPPRAGSVRLGAGPSRFCAIVASSARARARRPGFVSGAVDLAAEPVSLLRHRPELATLPVELERLGLLTLGSLAELPRAAMADRFGQLGLLAHDLACGRDTPLRPRRPGEVLEEVLELDESSSGAQLERALALLVDRLLARRERDGRTLRAVVLGATLVEGGTWRERVVFASRSPTRPECAWCSASGSGRCRRRRRACAWPSIASVRRTPRGPPSSTTAAPAAERACARRSARPGRQPAPRRPCGSSPSTPTRASPSDARC
jgi:protein ImuB